MIQLREIHTADTAYPFVETLWLEAFPDDERRATLAQRRNTDANPAFHCLLAESEGQAVGFFTYWDFGRYAYGEHFATDPQVRNHGYGGQIVAALLRHIGKPLVLEVELPTDEMSCRRVRFYERNGLRLWAEQTYLQPPYAAGKHALPMRLMATDGLTAAHDFADIVRTIHQEVYGVQTPVAQEG